MNTFTGPALIMRFPSSSEWQHYTLATTGEVNAVVNNVMHHMAQAGYSEKEQFAVRLSLEEAVVNAVKHGNGDDPRKCVQVDFRVDSSILTVRIEDEGSGFNPDAVPDPLAPENIERPGGRGVFLMRHYMSSVEFNDRGNAVTLTKRRE